MNGFGIINWCMPGRDPYDHYFVRDCPRATWTAYVEETPMTAILAGVSMRDNISTLPYVFGRDPVTIIIMCMTLVDKNEKREEGRIWPICLKGSM